MFVLCSKYPKFLRANQSHSTHLENTHTVVPILGNYAMIRRKLEAAREKGEPIPAAEEEKLWEEAHTWGAERLAATIGDLKGFYVKR